MRRLLIPLSAIVLVVTLGCEASGSGGITGPSGITNAATVTGSILNATTGGTSVRSTGAVVQIPGSSISTTVDPDQAFTLNNVPAGSNVVLRFTGTGLNTDVSIGPVGAGESVNVEFVRTNDELQVDRTGRRSADGTEIQGVIDNISSGSFLVLGQTILVDASTQFVRSSGLPATFAELTVGTRVTVLGTPSFGLSVIARTVQIDGVEIPVNLQGPIANLSGTALGFQFSVESRVVRGDSTTSFAAGTTFGTLTIGMQVDVTGVLRSGFIQARRIEVR